MRAKGLEFGRVVLYKFGNQAVTDDHVGVMRKIAVTGVTQLRREETLGLEYFFNGTYVGASRAQRRLLVVDTAEGLKRFWCFATDAAEIRGLLTDRRRPVWGDKDIHHMMRGDPSTWSEDRDDPRTLADRFFEQGKLEQSTYLLELARNQYAALDDQEREERCTALIHDIDGVYLEAAKSYERLGELEEAIRCYWEAKAYKNITEVSARDPGRFNASPFAVAARFISGREVPDRAIQFVKDLHQIGVERRRKQFKSSHWAEVVQKAVAVLIGDPKKSPPICTETAGEVYRALSHMQGKDGLTLEYTPGLSWLAFNADDPVAALDIWKQLKRRSGEREPEFVFCARAITTPYPQNLRYYDQLGDCRAVVLEYKAHTSTNLEPEYREIVIKALADQEDLPLAVDLVKAGGSWEDVRDFLTVLSGSQLDKESARSLLGTYLRKGLQKGLFRRVIEDLKPGRTDIAVLGALLLDEQILLATEASLIKLLARSDALVDERSDDKFVSGTIFTVAKKQANNLKNLVSPEEVGAALERAGRMDNALGFYESVYRDKQWGTDKGTEYNAKERWLRCKIRQAELDRKDERRKNQRLAEAKRMSAGWGVPIPQGADEEYPRLKALSLHEIDALLGALSRTVEPAAVVLSPTAVSEKQPTETKFPPEMIVPEAKAEISRIQPVVLGPGTIVRTGESRTLVGGLEAINWPLPSRPAFDGRIEFSCNCDGRNIKAKLLPRKRRLELVDETSDDLAMIKVADGVVESPDLKVTAVDEMTWKIDPWSLTVALVAASEDTRLVDLSDGEGQRILCLAI